MISEELDRIEKLYLSTSQGKWLMYQEDDDDNDSHDYEYNVGVKTQVGLISYTYTRIFKNTHAEANALFCAEAHTYVPIMIGYIRFLKGEIKEYREHIEKQAKYSYLATENQKLSKTISHTQEQIREALDTIHRVFWLLQNIVEE